MDSGPAFFAANLFLYSGENKWTLDTKKVDLQKERFLAIYFV